MKIVLKDSGRWCVTKVRLEHNHSLTPGKARYFKSHKELHDGVKRRLELSAQTGRMTSQTSEEIAIEHGGNDQLSFGLKECSNYLSKIKAMELCEGDAEAMLKFFDKMLAKCQNFFYVLDLNSKGSLVNIFWADSRSREAYEYFCDVVTFDTTYLTNRYKFKFAPFVGVNHHGQSILLGCGLLANETIESFVWLFTKWLMTMRGRAPNAIITDQAEAIQAAIEEVFPKAKHRLCLWHIMKKIPQKLCGLNEYKDIKRTMKKIVYESLRVGDFEREWKKMIDMYNLGTNNWLNTLYQLREKWVPVYLKNTFWAGMSTTGRSESMNVFFDKYLDAKISLKNFVERYELALHDKYEKECIADFSNFNSEPPLRMNHGFEMQLAPIYTHNIFKKFQEQLIIGLSHCYDFKAIQTHGAITTYNMKEKSCDKYGKRVESKEFEVYYNANEIEVTCICNWFEFKGYLCRHALYTLNHLGVDEIQSRYILPRWRKYFKRKYSLGYGSTKLSASNPLQRYGILYQSFSKLAEHGSISEESCMAALQGLEELQEKVRVTYSCPIEVGDKNNACNMSSGLHREIVSTSDHTTRGKVLDPKVGSNPGCPRQKRLVSKVDQVMQSKKKKRQIFSDTHNVVSPGATSWTLPNQHIWDPSIHSSTQQSIQNMGPNRAYASQLGSSNFSQDQLLRTIDQRLFTSNSFQQQTTTLQVGIAETPLTQLDAGEIQLSDV